MKVQSFWQLLFLVPAAVLILTPAAAAAGPQQNGPAPGFSAKTQAGTDFDLESRRGKGWTVLYFYPKAGTPGCTAQACAFRDAVEIIRRLNAEVFGVSTDKVEQLAAFHKEHQLRFDLLADPDGKIIALYGAKRSDSSRAQRWTFLIDPELKIRAIEKEVDPALDARKVAGLLEELQQR